MNKHDLIEQADLIRSLAAAAATTMPEEHEVRWRVALCRKLYTLLPLLDRRQLTRIHEAMAQVDYPNRDEANFRFAVQQELGRRFQLAEVRDLAIPGPAHPAPAASRPAALTR